MAQQGSTWGDPTAAGLFATAAGTTATWAILTHRIVLTDVSVFIAWLFAAALLLTMVGLIALKRGDTTTGVVNLCFGVLFFGAPALSFVFLLWGGSPLANIGLVIMPTNIVNGIVYFVLGIVLATFVPILGRQSGVISIGLLIFVIGIFFLAVNTLHGPGDFRPNPGTTEWGDFYRLAHICDWHILFSCQYLAWSFANGNMGHDGGNSWLVHRSRWLDNALHWHSLDTALWLSKDNPAGW